MIRKYLLTHKPIAHIILLIHKIHSNNSWTLPDIYWTVSNRQRSIAILLNFSEFSTIWWFHPIFFDIIRSSTSTRSKQRPQNNTLTVASWHPAIQFCDRWVQPTSKHLSSSPHLRTYERQPTFTAADPMSAQRKSINDTVDEVRLEWPSWRSSKTTPVYPTNECRQPTGPRVLSAF